MKAKMWWAALLCGAALTWPALAQQGGGAPPDPAPQEPPETPQSPPAEAAATEPVKKKTALEDPPLHRWGGWTISLAAWSPTPVGADDQIAVVVPESGEVPRPLTIPIETNIRESWRVAYHLPKGLGSIVGRYDSMRNDDERTVSSPAQFIYGQTLGNPTFAGAFDDSLADTVVGESMNKTRDTRVEYSDTAWESKRTRATWGAGVRNVDHNEQLHVTYLTLVPNLPAIIPPIVPQVTDPFLYNPRPDRVLFQSDYSGTGVTGSLDVEFQLHPRFSVISGLSLGLLRGKTTSIYKSFTSFYQSTQDGHYISREELINTLQFGPQSCSDVITICIDAITQTNIFNGYYAPDVSQASQAFDAYVGVQSMVWRGLRVFATFREMYYQNVGIDVTIDDDLVVTSTSKSVGYEGYLLGVSWRF